VRALLRLVGGGDGDALLQLGAWLTGGRDRGLLLRFVLLAARLGGGGDADGDAPFWPMPDRPARLLQLGDRLVDGALLRLAGRLVVGGDRGLASVTSVPTSRAAQARSAAAGASCARASS